MYVMLTTGWQTRRASARNRPLLALLQIPDDAFERVDNLIIRRGAHVETELQFERLGLRAERERIVLRAPRLRLGRGVAELLPRRAALTSDLLDERGHFLGRILPNYLQQQRLGGNVGQPTKIPDLL